MLCIHILLYIDRFDPDKTGKSNELVRKTSMVIFLIYLSDYFHIDDSISIYWMATEKGK